MTDPTHTCYFCPHCSRDDEHLVEDCGCGSEPGPDCERFKKGDGDETKD